MSTGSRNTTLSVKTRIARAAFTVVAEVDVHAGTPLAIIGPSGSGKSTILKQIAGVITPNEGAIRIGDEVWFDSHAGINVAPERRSVGYVPQGGALFDHMTTLGNVMFGVRDARGEREHVYGLLRDLEVAHLTNVPVSAASGGERQRIAVARALAVRPHALVLDEPTSSLDPIARDMTRRVIATALQRVHVPSIVVTHSIEEAAVLCRRVAVLDSGGIAQMGTITELAEAPTSSFVARMTGLNVLEGHVVDLAPSGIAHVELDNGNSITGTCLEPVTGAALALIAPTDITLTLEPPSSSARNVVAGPISSMHPTGTGVRVRVGELVAEVTSEAARELDLHVGVQVWAAAKATATRIVARSSHPDAG